MSHPLDVSAIKQGLERKTTQQLVDILTYTQDDYQKEAIPVIQQVLIERGLSITEIEVCLKDYTELKDKLDGQGFPIKNYKQAGFFPRMLNYIADHFICYGICYGIGKGGYFGPDEQYTFLALAVSIYILYYTITIGFFNATMGMGIMGLIVIDKDTKKKSSYLGGFTRGIGIVLTFLTIQIGHLLMLGSDKRTLVDRLSNTLVVYSK